MSTPRTLIDLVRHGEPQGGERFRGSRDDPLSDLGWAQLEHACAGGRWDVVVTSPLQRCAAFAQRLAARLTVPCETAADLREIGFGQWEGLTTAEVVAGWGEALRAFWRAPQDHPPPGSEPVAAFAARVDAAWQDITARHRGRRVLVVAHGGTIRMVVRAVLDVPLANAWRLRLGYAAVSTVELQHHAAYTLPVLVRLGAAQAEPPPPAPSASGATPGTTTG